MRSDWMRASVATIAVVGGVSVASADLSPVVFRIEANNGQGSGAWQVAVDAGSWNGDTYSYTLPGDIVIRNGTGEAIATLTDVTLSYVADPQVHLFFAVQAGVTDTNFSITSGTLSFPGISPAAGRATAAVTVTDLNSNGASMSNTGGFLYSANYNGATNFASLLASPVMAASEDSNAASDSSPASPGFSPIIGSVTDMSASFSFTLSAGDLATGSSNWIVIPTPGAAGVVIFTGAFGLLRRRR